MHITYTTTLPPHPNGKTFQDTQSKNKNSKQIILLQYRFSSCHIQNPRDGFRKYIFLVKPDASSSVASKRIYSIRKACHGQPRIVICLQHPSLIVPKQFSAGSWRSQSWYVSNVFVIWVHNLKIQHKQYFRQCIGIYKPDENTHP